MTLTRQVACTDGIVDPNLLDRMRHEVLTVPAACDWVSGYGPYQSGGWGTLSLLNATGRATDVTIADCEPGPTDLLAAMPATRAWLAELGLTYMWARIARLDAASYLWEHRDYRELADVERHRLHIPIETSPSAFLVLSGRAIHLQPGKIWRLTPTYAHGAVNLHGPARIHLILDCYANPALDALSSGAHLPEAAVRQLPAPTAEMTGRLLSQARSLLRLGFAHAAEQYLLRSFFTYAQPEGHIYDLISAMHEYEGAPGDAEVWRDRKSTLLGTPKTTVTRQE